MGKWGVHVAGMPGDTLGPELVVDCTLLSCQGPWFLAELACSLASGVLLSSQRAVIGLRGAGEGAGELPVSSHPGASRDFRPGG